MIDSCNCPAAAGMTAVTVKVRRDMIGGLTRGTHLVWCDMTLLALMRRALENRIDMAALASGLGMTAFQREACL